MPRRAWQRLSAGPGAKGERYYDWALIAHSDPAGTHDSDGVIDEQRWWLLVRRHSETGELARVAGRRWTIEESFQAGKGLAGLDEHQVRRWTSWQRWTLLALLALAVIAAHEHANQPPPEGLIALTCSEIRRLLTIFVTEPARTRTCPEAWSRWRRRHQHRARTSHYRRQEAAQPWT